MAPLPRGLDEEYQAREWGDRGQRLPPTRPAPAPPPAPVIPPPDFSVDEHLRGPGESPPRMTAVERMLLAARERGELPEPELWPLPAPPLPPLERPTFPEADWRTEERRAIEQEKEDRIRNAQQILDKHNKVNAE